MTLPPETLGPKRSTVTLAWAAVADQQKCGLEGLLRRPTCLGNCDQATRQGATAILARPSILRLAPRLLANNNLAARATVIAGLGIAFPPRFQVARMLARGQMEEVLPGWTKPPVPVHAVFSSSRYPTPTIRAFVDHAKRAFPAALAGA